MSQLTEQIHRAEPIVAKYDVVHLPVIDRLLQTFHRLNIRYCHWKSSEHLDASMVGNTDLDILFDEQIKMDVELAVKSCGFKKFVPIKIKQYQGIEDYIGLDFASGKVVHLHAHFKLTLGEQHLKGYQLNLESRIVDSRIFDSTYGIYRITPAFELILLYIRYALKIRNRDIIKNILHKNRTYSKNVLKEYRWLKERCSNDEIEAVLASFFPQHMRMYNLIKRDFNHKVLLKLSYVLKYALKEYRLHSQAKATMLRWFREVSLAAYRSWAKFSQGPVSCQRVHPGSGLTVALIGADGSGKSTVVENLQTFRKKIDVFNIYMGKGKSGKKSATRKLLILFKKYFSKKKTGISNTVNVSKQISSSSLKYNVFKCVEALIVANERKNKLKLMQQAKSKGMLVICDRFPQNQFMGYNDGPALHYLLASKNPVFRACARRESKIYHLAQNTPPDLVFKLVADVDVIAERKPSLVTSSLLQQKIDSIKQMQFGNSCTVITVDANKPIGEVLYSVRKNLWTAWV